MRRPAVALVLGLGLGPGPVGCGYDAEAPPEVTVPEHPLYHRDVAQVMQRRCVGCHQPGNLAPFPLLTWEQVKPLASNIASAVRARRMPPLPAVVDEGCPPIDDPRAITDPEREILLRWHAQGAPPGDPAPPLDPPPPYGPLGPPALTFPMAEAYRSTGGGSDDYRCFVIDPQVTTALPVAAVSVLPGNRQIVHHASVYLVPKESVAALRRLDDADPGPGYTCFGGVGVALAYPTGVWVPGADRPLQPPRQGVGYYVPAGWVFVLQNHYNYANGRAADQSAVTVWRAPDLITEVPHALYLSDTGFVLPPGERSVSRELSGPVLPVWSVPQIGQVQEGSIYSAWAHMHLLGRSFRLDLVRPDGQEQCLLHIPSWDFHWQSIYRFQKPVRAGAFDRVRMRCEWDNSAEHQPIVDGTRPPPREVRYGERTADEMCLGTLALTNF